MIKAWMRDIEVILTSSKLKQRMIFSTSSNVSLNIKISGYKYLSALKDNFTVKITNLTYKEILTLISGQFYDIEIKCGYKSTSTFTIFKGAVIYISNILTDRKSNEVIILCGNKITAAYGQARMNMTLQSGINMYSAINFICKRAGVQNAYIDEDFKYRIIREVTSANQTVGSFMDLFSSNNCFLVQGDSSYGSNISVWDPYRKDTRKIVLDSSKIILTSGYPTLTSEGLRISLLPTFNFMPGDTIVIDNSILNIGVDSMNDISENRGYFMDESGQYIIYEIEMQLENRGSAYSMNMLCKSKNLMNRIVGGKSNE